MTDGWTPARWLVRGGVRRYGPWHQEDAQPEGLFVAAWRATCHHCSRPIVRRFPWIATWRHDMDMLLRNDWLVEPVYSDTPHGGPVP